MPAAAPMTKASTPFGQRERQVLPHRLAEAGVGDAEQPREIDAAPGS